MRLVGRTYCVSEHQWCTVHQGPEICLLLCQCLSICLWASWLVFICNCMFVCMSVSDSSSPVCLWLYLHLSVCLSVCFLCLYVSDSYLHLSVCSFVCLIYSPGICSICCTDAYASALYSRPLSPAVPRNRRSGTVHVMHFCVDSWLYSSLCSRCSSASWLADWLGG